MLKADVVAEPRAGGGVRLRIKSQTGEAFGVELSAEATLTLRNAVDSATKSVVHAHHAEPEAPAASVSAPDAAPVERDQPETS